MELLTITILANIFLIEFLRKLGKGSEDRLWSWVSQEQDPFERSRGARPPSENDFEVFKLQKVWVIYSMEFTTTWLTIFLQKKINIKLKYLPEKFGNSGESNSCPGSPVKGQNYWGSGRNSEHWHVCECQGLLVQSKSYQNRLSNWYLVVFQ